MRYIVTTNRHIQLIEDDGNGKILDSKGFQFGQLYYRIVRGKVTFYHFDQDQPWRNDVWSADIPLQINGELYETEEEVGNKLYEVMEDSLFDKIEDLIEEDARLDQKIDDEIDRAKEEENELSSKVDVFEDEIDEISHKVDGYDERIQNAEEKVDAVDEKLDAEILRSTSKDAEHDAFISGMTDNLNAEIERAKAAESALTQALNSEISRAISAETEIANDLDAEVARATNRENEIDNKLNSEITRSTEKDAIHDEKLANLDTGLQNEIERATEAENSLRSNLNSEISRATAEEERIDAKLSSEITRSTNKDTEHDEKIASLEQADENMAEALNSEIQRALSAETSLRDDLNAEIARATNAEDALDTKIDQEIARANAEETRIEGLINNEITRSTNKDTEHDNLISGLTDASDALDAKIDKEIADRISGDTNLQNQLDAEISRATNAEDALDTKIDQEIADREADVDAEEARAKAAEDALDDKLDAEILRSTSKDTEHDNLISGISEDIDDLEAALNSEIQRALSAETNLHNEIVDEKNRAINAETNLNEKVNALSAHNASQDSQINALGNSINTEISRATSVENALRSDLNTETSARTAADTAQIERIVALEVGKANKSDVYTKVESDAKYATKDYVSGITENFYTKSETNTLLADKADKVDAVASAEYVSSTKKINFKNIDGAIISEVDATAFIKDGMVDNVEIANGNLVITFNTDSGKEPISIPLSDIFDPSNYYTKDEVDESQLAQDNKINAISGDVQTLSGEVQTISGNAITSGEVQTMIDESVSGKADKTDIYTYIGTDRITVSDTTGTRRKAIDLNVPIYKGNGMLSISCNNMQGTSGGNNNIKGMTSFGAGFDVQTNNHFEAAFGTANKTAGNSTAFQGSSGNTLFTVGNGSGSHRHNAFEVRQNGDIYIANTNGTSTADYYNKPMIKLQDALGGGSSYTAGDGIDITNDVISVTGRVDTTTYNTYTAATNTTLESKADVSTTYTKVEVNNLLNNKIWCGTQAEYDNLQVKDPSVLFLIHE